MTLGVCKTLLGVQSALRGVRQTRVDAPAQSAGRVQGSQHEVRRGQKHRSDLCSELSSVPSPDMPTKARRRGATPTEV